VKGEARGGFSLVEVMVAVGLLSLLVLLVMPGYREWIDRSRVMAASGSVADGLRLARHEAVQRGARTRFELDGERGAHWMACVLPPGGATCTDAGDAGLLAQGDAAETGGVLLSMAGGGVEFNGEGRPVEDAGTSGARVEITSAADPSRRMVAIVGTGGVVRRCDPDAAPGTYPGMCPA
jgi:type IV fimbrial biogenesis protein FimT